MKAYALKQAYVRCMCLNNRTCPWKAALCPGPPSASASAVLARVSTQAACSLSAAVVAALVPAALAPPPMLAPSPPAPWFVVLLGPLPSRLAPQSPTPPRSLPPPNANSDEELLSRPRLPMTLLKPLSLFALALGPVPAETAFLLLLPKNSGGLNILDTLPPSYAATLVRTALTWAIEGIGGRTTCVSILTLAEWAAMQPWIANQMLTTPYTVDVIAQFPQITIIHLGSAGNEGMHEYK
mmetsp:Transcript_40149/g.105899  ORF Transcript_40149/g.105899 Transcript_40149/m.105899 type:complete len:239 (-) Transcript_40149:300-1016(-)